MAYTVRDIIIEAGSRANIVPRARKMPEDIFQSCLNLFNGVMEEMSAKDYITAYQDEVEFRGDKERIVLGPREDDDVVIEKLQMPKRAMYKADGQLSWSPLNFIAYEDFYSVAYDAYTVSWKPKSMTEWTIYLKPRFVQGTQYTIKLIYNVQMEFKDNDIINLPVPYVELITRALAYKIAVKYPRADDTKRLSLKAEQEELEGALKANNASLKIITRGTGADGSYLSSLRSGAFIGRW